MFPVTKAALAALALVLIAPAEAADTKSVAITQIVEHPALDACRKGVEDELKAQGIEVTWTYESAQGNPGTAAQIARKLGVSVRTLDRHCKRHFGQTPMQLYLGIRLQAARNFLFYEDYNIKEVALAYGFSSPAVFSRTFKLYFGQTPTAFRRSIRDRQSQTRLPEIRRLYTMRS